MHVLCGYFICQSDAGRILYLCIYVCLPSALITIALLVAVGRSINRLFEQTQTRRGVCSAFFRLYVFTGQTHYNRPNNIMFAAITSGRMPITTFILTHRHIITWINIWSSLGATATRQKHIPNADRVGDGALSLFLLAGQSSLARSIFSWGVRI